LNNLISGLAFIVSGFVQLAIDKELTPIPDYGYQNSLMVVNGYHANRTLQVNGPDYWNFVNEDGNEYESSFMIDTVSRT
jgi:hypothetical protein